MGYIVNLNLRQKPVLLVGAGSVAWRKVCGLLEAGASVTVVAPSICQQIRALQGSKKISLDKRPYQSKDIEGKVLVVAATGDEAVNAQVWNDAAAARILVNVVDRPELCSFTLPAVVRRGDLSFAVATEGRCPALAQALKEELESRYGEDYGKALALLGDLRRVMIAEGWSNERVKNALKALYSRGIVRLLASGDREALRVLLSSEAGEGLIALLRTF